MLNEIILGLGLLFIALIISRINNKTIIQPIRLKKNFYDIEKGS